MRKFTLRMSALLMFLALGSFAMAQMPDAITVTPENATAMDELTLTIDPAKACFESATLVGVDTIRFHGGVGFDDGTTWAFVVDWNKNGVDGTLNALLPNGDGTYSMTFTPKSYFGVPDTSLSITKLCGVFNDGTWDADGRDFDADENCTDFFIPLGGVGINDGPSLSSFSLYPNPVGNQLTIENINGVNKIEVFNVIGELVKSVDNLSNAGLTINTADLTSGVYFDAFHNESGVQTSKFVKN